MKYLDFDLLRSMVLFVMLTCSMLIGVWLGRDECKRGNHFPTETE